MKIKLPAAMFLLLSVAPSFAIAAVMYHVTDLEGIGGLSGGYGINDYGQVAGASTATQGIRAILWTPDTPNGVTGSVIDLGSFFKNGTSAANGVNAINASGQVTGYARTSTGKTHAFVWNPSIPNDVSGVMYDLGALPNGSLDHSMGLGINNYGQVSGESESPGQRAFLWQPSTPNASTGTMLNTGGSGTGYSINSRGQIVGDYGLWSPTTPNGTTGSITPVNTPVGQGGVSINSYGKVIAGRYLWTPNTPNGTTGSYIDMGLLGSDNNTNSKAINDRDEVVGVSFAQSPGGGMITHSTAFIRATDGQLYDLNTLLDDSGVGWNIQDAKALNNLGQITGIGEYTSPDGVIHSHGFLLTPTTLLPEPAMLMPLAGMLLILSRSRGRTGSRRRRLC